MIIETTLKHCPHCLHGSIGNSIVSYYSSGKDDFDDCNMSPSVYSKALVICPNCKTRLWYDDLDLIGIVKDKDCALREFMERTLQLEGSDELKNKYNYTASIEARNNNTQDEFYEELYEVWKKWDFKCEGERLIKEDFYPNHRWRAVTKRDVSAELGSENLTNEKKDYLLWWLDTYNSWQDKQATKDTQEKGGV